MKLNVKEVVKMILDFMNAERGVHSIIDMHLPVIYVLYGIHKNYNVTSNIFKFKFDCKDDKLHDDLYECSRMIIPRDHFLHLDKLYRELSIISRDFFEDNYISILCELNKEISSVAGRNKSDFYTPEELSALIAYYLDKEGCKSIFDPFCGTASIIHYLQSPKDELHFEGQDINPEVSLLARVNVEAHTGSDNGIKCTDSIKEWNNGHFDAVCSCPPFGLKIPEETLSENEFRLGRVILENIIFDRAYHLNSANIVVLLEPLGFSFREGSEKWLRRGLVESYFLDTIIALPSNLLFGTSIPCILMICKSGREQGQSVTFIDANDYITGDSKIKRQFDINSFIGEIESNDPKCTFNVSLDKIREFDYNLNPSLYIHSFKYKDGQRVLPLNKLINLEEGIKTELFPSDKVVNSSLMSSNFIQVLLNANKSTLEKNLREKNKYRTFYPEGKKYILNITVGGENRFYLHDSNEPFICASGIKVFSVNEDIVLPKYLLSVLLSNPAVINSRMSLMQFQKYTFVIDCIQQQKALVDSRLIQYHARMQRLQESEARRLGVKQNVSDLEHMLGSTQQKLNNIIDRLSRITPENEKYPVIVKQLKDNMEYMNRIIHYNNASIEEESLNIQEHDFCDFIENYLSAWGNYGGNYFRIEILNNVIDNFIVCFDKALFTVMLDSVLNNAIRHGFHKRKDYTPENKVYFELDIEKYKDNPYLVIRIANNGDPISDDFTIDDYITKGRFTSDTGRSGLGGYHVYQIVKGHKGYLALDSNKVWNMIVVILIPVTNVETKNIVEYEHECI